MSEYPGHFIPALKTEWGWGVLRILMGWLFLWGFLDKMFGLGYATKSGKAWINGFSPTEGYLKFGSSGLLEGFYKGMAGNAFIDVVFMLALLALGTALILGIGMRIAFYGGSILLLMLWSSNLPPANNPIIDEHIIFIAVLFVLERVNAGRYLGIGKKWKELALVKRFPILE
jgi:thiosulfate dehydrogenase [quinone] large subunit